MNLQMNNAGGTEILNIWYHKKRLVLKALNTCDTVQVAAEKLGISVRSIYRYMGDMEIIPCEPGGRKKFVMLTR